MGPWGNITLEGTFNPFGIGLYYATLKLGNPSKKHTFQIDTGSVVSWVACKGCTDCTNKSISAELYNPDSSSTSSKVSCLDNSCVDADETGSAVCKTPFALCGYNLTYGDESNVSGYYVNDTMHFDTIMGNQLSASLVFGCTKSVSHFFPTDGILGFAQTQLSIISQLNSQGLSPKVFSHCLKGSKEGGAILVLGKIVAPRLVFTPLVSSRYLYTLNLESIAVNGQKLPIDSSLFATSNSKATIVDSGTTLVYLVEGAYHPLVSAIGAAISPSVATLDSKWNGKRDNCFRSASSIDLLFPKVTLYFKGGAAMTVKPSQYLLQQGTDGNNVVWCIAWQSSQAHKDIQGMNVLGDIVLHDKIIVYDLEKKRMGWTDYNFKFKLLSATARHSIAQARLM